MTIGGNAWVAGGCIASTDKNAPDVIDYWDTSNSNSPNITITDSARVLGGPYSSYGVWYGSGRTGTVSVLGNAAIMMACDGRYNGTSQVNAIRTFDSSGKVTINTADAIVAYNWPIYMAGSETNLTLTKGTVYLKEWSTPFYCGSTVEKYASGSNTLTLWYLDQDNTKQTSSSTGWKKYSF